MKTFKYPTVGEIADATKIPAIIVAIVFVGSFWGLGAYVGYVAVSGLAFDVRWPMACITLPFLLTVAWLRGKQP